MTRSGLRSSRIFERPGLRALLDEEIERIVDRHVGDDVDFDLQFVDKFREDVAREPVAVRILLMVHEMLGGRNLQRVRDDPGAAVGRGPEPDDLRAERHRAIVFVVCEVMDRGSDRHGFRGLVTARRPFHNLLRRTIGAGRGALAAALAERGWRGRRPRLRRRPSSAIGECRWRAQWTAKGILRATGLAQPFWQKEFFDHLLRSDESYEFKWLYVRENPVRAGLVSTADDWPYAGEITPIMR